MSNTRFNDNTGSFDSLDRVVAAYLQAAETGPPPNRAEWLERFPTLAEPLKRFFDDLDQMDNALAPLRINHAADATAATETSGAEIRPTIRYVGDYELLQEVARGGMGVVYKARQNSLNRTVALKMILSGSFASPREVQRFRAEAEAAAGLEHPHIVPIFEVGEHQGHQYFSMRLVDGVPLSQHPRGTLHQEVEAFSQAALAVHYAHQHGVLHRDLKPSNILVDHRGNWHVTDFGLAKRMTDLDRSLTEPGQLLGTPRYMAPEQAAGRKDLTVAADVYSLGVILYERLTGRAPFQSENVMTLLRQVRDEPPPRPSQIAAHLPADLETIILKCLEKEPGRRYESAADLADDLGRWAAGQPILARPVPPLERAWLWCKRNRAVSLLGTAVAASLLLGTVVSLGFAIQARNQARQEADARLRAEIAEREAQSSREKLETSLVRSLVAPLNPSPASPETLSYQEAVSLKTLAASTEPGIGTRFLEAATSDRFSLDQLVGRAEPALIAALGIDPARRDQAIALFARRLEEENSPLDPADQARLATLALQLLPEDDPRASRFTRAILDAFKSTTGDLETHPRLVYTIDRLHHLPASSFLKLFQYAVENNRLNGQRLATLWARINLRLPPEQSYTLFNETWRAQNVAAYDEQATATLTENLLSQFETNAAKSAKVTPDARIDFARMLFETLKANPASPTSGALFDLLKRPWSQPSESSEAPSDPPPTRRLWDDLDPQDRNSWLIQLINLATRPEAGATSPRVPTSDTLALWLGTLASELPDAQATPLADALASDLLGQQLADDRGAVAIRTRALLPLLPWTSEAVAIQAARWLSTNIEENSLDGREALSTWIDLDRLDSSQVEKLTRLAIKAHAVETDPDAQWWLLVGLADLLNSLEPDAPFFVEINTPTLARQFGQALLKAEYQKDLLTRAMARLVIESSDSAQAAYPLSWLLWDRGDWIYAPKPAEEDLPTINRLQSLIDAWEHADEPTLSAIKTSFDDYTQGTNKPSSDPASFYHEPPNGMNDPFPSRATKLTISLSLAADRLPMNVRTLLAAQLETAGATIEDSPLAREWLGYKPVIACLKPLSGEQGVAERVEQVLNLYDQARESTRSQKNCGLEGIVAALLFQASPALPFDKQVSAARQYVSIFERYDVESLFWNKNEGYDRLLEIFGQVPADQAAQLATVFSQAIRDEPSADARFWLLTGLAMLLERLEADQIPPTVQDHAAHYAAALTGPAQDRPDQQATRFQTALQKLTHSWQGDKLTPLLASMGKLNGWTTPDAAQLDTWLARFTPAQALTLWKQVETTNEFPLNLTGNPLLPRLLVRLPAPFVASLPGNPTGGIDPLASLPETTPFAATLLKPPTTEAALSLLLTLATSPAPELITLALDALHGQLDALSPPEAEEALDACRVLAAEPAVVETFLMHDRLFQAFNNARSARYRLARELLPLATPQNPTPTSLRAARRIAELLADNPAPDAHDLALTLARNLVNGPTLNELENPADETPVTAPYGTLDLLLTLRPLATTPQPDTAATKETPKPAPSSPRFSASEYLDLLKRPTCIGASRQRVLEKLEPPKAGPLGVWNFLAGVDDLKPLDLETPPQMSEEVNQ